jgi:hypothetical protein
VVKLATWPLVGLHFARLSASTQWWGLVFHGSLTYGLLPLAGFSVRPLTRKSDQLPVLLDAFQTPQQQTILTLIASWPQNASSND